MAGGRQLRRRGRRRVARGCPAWRRQPPRPAREIVAFNAGVAPVARPTWSTPSAPSPRAREIIESAPRAPKARRVRAFHPAVRGWPMSDILQKICAVKVEEVAAAAAARPQCLVRGRRGAASRARFRRRDPRQNAARRPAVIAETKKPAPPKGVIRPDFHPRRDRRRLRARQLPRLPVRCSPIAAFPGRAPEYLQAARAACHLPVHAQGLPGRSLPGLRSAWRWG